MNQYHDEFIALLRKYSGMGTKYQAEREKRYIGSTKHSYTISSPVKKQLVKGWIKQHPSLSFSEYLDLLNALYLGTSHDEISLGGKLLEYIPTLRKQLKPEHLDAWLGITEGWAEVDSICQSNFTAEELLANWSAWKKLICQCSMSKNIHKRRASLVLLTGPVRKNTDTKLSALAFEVIAKLQTENDILITKAISWLFRNMIKHHRKEVEMYLKENFNSLPKIAIRETNHKLLTGRK